eukprot:401527-Pleurochrysis_carterae.AAC.1
MDNVLELAGSTGMSFSAVCPNRPMPFYDGYNSIQESRHGFDRSSKIQDDYNLRITKKSIAPKTSAVHNVAFIAQPTMRMS